MPNQHRVGQCIQCPAGVHKDIAADGLCYAHYRARQRAMDNPEAQAELAVDRHNRQLLKAIKARRKFVYVINNIIDDSVDVITDEILDYFRTGVGMVEKAYPGGVIAEEGEVNSPEEEGVNETHQNGVNSSHPVYLLPASTEPEPEFSSTWKEIEAKAKEGVNGSHQEVVNSSHPVTADLVSKPFIRKITPLMGKALGLVMQDAGIERNRRSIDWTNEKVYLLLDTPQPRQDAGRVVDALNTMLDADDGWCRDYSPQTNKKHVDACCQLVTLMDGAIQDADEKRKE